MKRNQLLVAATAASVVLLSASVEARDLIQNKGSDTLVNVAQAWAEAYQTVDPDVAVAVSGGGSGTGIAALINGTVDLANASRAMKQKEIEGLCAPIVSKYYGTSGSPGEEDEAQDEL